VFSSRWVGDDAVWVHRSGRTSPPFPEVKLADRAPLAGADFPLVHPREARS
jgi:hypothetical protein